MSRSLRSNPDKHYLSMYGTDSVIKPKPTKVQSVVKTKSKVSAEKIKEKLGKIDERKKCVYIMYPIEDQTHIKLGSAIDFKARMKKISYDFQEDMRGRAFCVNDYRTVEDKLKITFVNKNEPRTINKPGTPKSTEWYRFHGDIDITIAQITKEIRKYEIPSKSYDYEYIGDYHLEVWDDSGSDTGDNDSSSDYSDSDTDDDDSSSDYSDSDSESD